MKKVSIVLPTYNGEKYLRESIDSILGQTFEHWELIVVNDCSVDKTPEIVEEYCHRDSRIRVVHNKVNQRLPRSLNIGFAHATGDYLTWTSDDNRYKSQALGLMHDFLEANPGYGLVYCNMDDIDEDGNVISQAALGPSALYYENCVRACFMYTREAAEAIGGYDPNMFLVEDYDYWLRINEVFPVGHLPKNAYTYRFHGSSLTMTKSWQIRQQMHLLRKKRLGFLLENIQDSGREALFLDMWAVARHEIWKQKDCFFPEGKLPKRIAWLERIHKGENRMDYTKQIILFGAGDYGKRALDYFGREKVYCFIDNNKANVGKIVEGVPIMSFEHLVEVARDYQIVISVVAKTAVILANQLEEAGIRDYALFIEMVDRITKGSLKESMDYVAVFRRAVGWVETNTIPGAGIINHTGYLESYPEVTGYYIPTLLNWGYRKRAVDYAKWLCSIQREDGSWCDTSGRFPYVFDSAQILKGLLDVRRLLPEAERHIRRGCDWLLENIQSDGHMTTPDESLWDPCECSDLIHLYCLEPLYTAAQVYEVDRYRTEADRVKKYYLENRMDEIMDFGMLSHFYAYVMEALCDIGEEELAEKAMAKVFTLQRADGSVPAYKDVNWVCSTGLFQFALVWYKLGELEKGNRAFRYACSLQNPSGGWYGGYAAKADASALDSREYPTYFVKDEISWAVKYFLDALSWKCKVEFEAQVDSFVNTLDKEDGRYQCVRNVVLSAGTDASVCDVGCGKGRYLRGLLEDNAGRGVRFSCADISEIALKDIPEGVEKRQGTLNRIPYPDEIFDVVYTTEALEHAICVENAMAELVRVTKKGGHILVIDKNKSCLGALAIDDWEQWFDDEFFRRMAKELHCRLEIYENLSYDGGIRDGLFNGWVLYRE